MVLTKLATETIDELIKFFQRKDNQEKIKTFIVDPMIYYILDRLYPYIFVTATIFILIFVMTIMTLFVIIRK